MSYSPSNSNRSGRNSENSSNKGNNSSKNNKAPSKITLIKPAFDYQKFKDLSLNKKADKIKNNKKSLSRSNSRKYEEVEF